MLTSLEIIKVGHRMTTKQWVNNFICKAIFGIIMTVNVIFARQ